MPIIDRITTRKILIKAAQKCVQLKTIPNYDYNSLLDSKIKQAKSGDDILYRLQTFKQQILCS